MSHMGYGPMGGGARMEIGETHVTIFDKTNSKGVSARILARHTNESGEVVHIVTDRLMVRPRDLSYSGRFGDWQASGAFATEFSLIDPCAPAAKQYR